MSNRTNIYYWKCDRPEAFANLGKGCDDQERTDLETGLNLVCSELYGSEDYSLKAAFGQGNHRNFSVCHGGTNDFIRVENSHDKDDYMIVETEVIRRVRRCGIPVPDIYHVDASRERFPFAYQVMEQFKSPDINSIYKRGNLDTEVIMRQLGSYIAIWQSVSTEGFGLFDTEALKNTGMLKGLHATYPEYYYLNLKAHLSFLVERGFITRSFSSELLSVVDRYSPLLELDKGCLVHKDIAFWNLLGTCDHIDSVIDWDDTIMGDPTDDLSLMACYHSWEELKPLLEGYASVKQFPDNFEKRFWLHLLRNIIFKAVIRVGADYFEKNDDFFLVGQDKGGSDLKAFTLSRLEAAYDGLNGKMKIEEL